MNTTLTSVLGETGFGSDFERFLWLMHDSSENISGYTRNLIQQNCPSQSDYNWDLGCTKVLDNNGEEFYYLVIIIMDSEENLIRKTYVIHNFANSGDDRVIRSSQLKY